MTFGLNSVCLIAGGDLHYHLSQHGVFSEREARFYATEIILGLEHMHGRSVVYRDQKVRLGGGGVRAPVPRVCSHAWGHGNPGGPRSSAAACRVPVSLQTSSSL